MHILCMTLCCLPPFCQVPEDTFGVRADYDPFADKPSVFRTHKICVLFWTGEIRFDLMSAPNELFSCHILQLWACWFRWSIQTPGYRRNFDIIRISSILKQKCHVFVQPMSLMYATNVFAFVWYVGVARHRCSGSLQRRSCAPLWPKFWHRRGVLRCLV